MASKAKFKNIHIEGARTNNLKQVNIKFPLNEISCVSGPSGSGKSSLVLGTLVDESKRRFINSLPNDVKFLWKIPSTADVDKIEPILPVWSLTQINPVVGSRPVVSDILGITELLVRHFCVNGVAVCAECLGPIRDLGPGEHLDKWLKNVAIDSVVHLLIKKGDYVSIAETGSPVRSCKSKAGAVGNFEQDHLYWEVVRFRRGNLIKGLKRLSDFIGPRGISILARIEGSRRTKLFRPFEKTCVKCEVSFKASDFGPDKFNPLLASGACSECDGFGQILEYDLSKIIKNESLTLDEGAIPILTYKQFSHLMEDFKKDLRSKKINPDTSFAEMPKVKFDVLIKGGRKFCGLVGIYEYLNKKKYKRSIRILSRRLKTERDCESCNSSRLNSASVSLVINNSSLKDSLREKLKKVESGLRVEESSKDLSCRKLLFLINTAKELGLGNLELNRKVKSLSSGEYQRLLLTKILAQEGTGMLFVLDEPSRGLSIGEQEVLFDKLAMLKKQGNTVILIDHSEYLQKRSSFLIKMGPGAGSRGGKVLSIKKQTRFIKTSKKLKYPRSMSSKNYLEVFDSKIIDFKFKKIKLPLYKITNVVGNSGTGKSLFFKKILYAQLVKLHTGERIFDLDYTIGKLHSTSVIKKVNYFDPELRKTSSRSTVGTYLGFSELVRKHYAKLDVSIKLDYKMGHFSPNSDLGKCPSCEGRGSIEIDMQFLENLVMKCEDCNGKKLRYEIATLYDGNYTVSDSYNFPLLDILKNYKLTPKFKVLLEYTCRLNLSHLSLSRTVQSLSGGERLRLQFLKALNLMSSNELFIFDNLSIGLSELELEGVFKIINELKKKKNTIVIIDSNPYFLDKIDNVIDFNSLR